MHMQLKLSPYLCCKWHNFIHCPCIFTHVAYKCLCASYKNRRRDSENKAHITMATPSRLVITSKAIELPYRIKIRREREMEGEHQCINKNLCTKQTR